MSSKTTKSKDRHVYETYLLAALRQALRPLVSFLLHKGVTFPVFTDLLRGLYVEQALEDFESDKKPMPDSRLSLLTGIARRYVKALRQEVGSEKALQIKRSYKASTQANLIAEWLTNPSYLDADNQPLAIPHRAEQNGDSHEKDTPSFESLARHINSDAWPPTLLNSLLEAGLVAIDKEERVYLLTNAYVPEGEVFERLDIFSSHLHDHLATLRHNFLSEEDKLLERSAYQSGLDDKSVIALSDFVEKNANELLQVFYAEAAKRARNDAANDTQTEQKKRVRLGIYFYHQPQSSSEKAATKKRG